MKFQVAVAGAAASIVVSLGASSAFAGTYRLRRRVPKVTVKIGSFAREGAAYPYAAATTAFKAVTAR